MMDLFPLPKCTLDTQGLRCPEPMMLIKKTMRNIDIGEILLIIADDPSTTRDILYFCNFMKHNLLTQQISVIPYQYLIQKGKIDD